MIMEMLTAVAEFPGFEEPETVTIKCFNRCGEQITVDINDDSELEHQGWRRVAGGWVCPYAEIE